MADTLADALQREITRVRDEVMPFYDQAGAGGVLGLGFLRASVEAASKALTDGNAIACLHAYEDLRTYVS